MNLRMQIEIKKKKNRETLKIHFTVTDMEEAGLPPPLRSVCDFWG